MAIATTRDPSPSFDAVQSQLVADLWQTFGKSRVAIAIATSREKANLRRAHIASNGEQLGYVGIDLHEDVDVIDLDRLDVGLPFDLICETLLKKRLATPLGNGSARQIRGALFQSTESFELAVESAGQIRREFIQLVGELSRSAY